MSTTADYDDITRPTSDFFSKPFPSTKLVKVGTETKADSLTLKTASQRAFIKNRTTGLTEEIYDTTVEPKYELKDLGVVVEGKFQIQNVLSATVSHSNLVQGLKLSFGGTQDTDDLKVLQKTVNVGGEFSHEKFFFKGNLGYPLEEKRPISLSGNLVVQPVDKVFLGAKFDFKRTSGDEPTLQKEVEFKLAGSSGATKGHVTGSLDKKVGLFVNHQVNSDLVVGFSGKFELPQKDEDPTKVVIDVAAQQKVCKHTSVQGKLNVTPPAAKALGVRLGLAFSHNLPNTGVTATLGADCNVSSFLGIDGHLPHSLGFELKLK